MGRGGIHEALLLLLLETHLSSGEIKLSAKNGKKIIVKVKLASDRPFDCSLLASAHNNHLATRIHSKCVQINIILRTLKLRLQLLPSWLPCALERLGEPRTDPYGFAAAVVVGPV